MEVNKHINFLKRRGLLIKESSEINLPINEGYMDFDSKCKHGETVFCGLNDLANKEHVTPTLRKELMVSISKIFYYLKPPINNNNSRFTRLIGAILNQKSETSINTFKILSEKLDEVNLTKLRKALDTLGLKKVVDGSDIKDAVDEVNDEFDIQKVISGIKHQSYTEYENSFVGNHFISYKTRLMFFVKSEEDENATFTNQLLNTEESEYDLAKSLYDKLLTNFSKGIGTFIKADLKCTKDVVDENGVTIIEDKQYVEVKKLDYTGDSYLSEFFAIYKNKPIDDDISRYNKVIDTLYMLLDRNDKGMLDTIKNSFAGIIYEKNRFIPNDQIEVYWSNKGQRTVDHRLSLRYRVNTDTITSYVYSKNEDILKTETISGETSGSKEYVKLDYTVDDIRSIKEATDKKGNDWGWDSPQGKMIRTKGGTQEPDLDFGFDWVKNHLDSVPDDPRVLALINEFGGEKVLGPSFNYDDKSTYYGGMVIFSLNNGEEWAVGTIDQADNALREYWRDYVDNNEYDGIDISEFVSVSDYWIEDHCNSEADDYVDSMDEEEIIEQGDWEGEYEDLLDDHKKLDAEIDETRDIVNGLRSRLNKMEVENEDYTQYGYTEPPHDEESMDKFMAYYEEHTSKLQLLLDKYDDWKYDKDDYIDKYRNVVREERYDEEMGCMEDPVNCLVDEKGWYSDASEMVESLGLDVDTNGLVHQLVRESGYDSIGYGSYEETKVDDTWYVLIRTD